MTATREGAVWTALLAMQRLSWEQGVVAHAALDHARGDLVAALADDAVVRQDAQGRLGEVDGGGLVNCGALVEVVAVEAARTGRVDLAAALARQAAWFDAGCPRAADGTLLHLAGSAQVWTDSVYMLVPALLRLDRADAALVQLAGHRSRLRGDDGLWAARWDEPTATLVAPQRWGTGNGWVAAGLARAWRERAAAPHRAALAAEATAVVTACLAHRRADGLFHDVVDDPGSFVEANLAQMLAYAVLTGVADGWLDAGWADVGRDLRAAAARGVDADGLVRPVAGAPHFDRPGRSAEAQAFFLLALAAERRVDALG
ncbi:glycoside hydrolase family 88 protein [Actinotalea solisilvae]|uniref:glycoside hydrolase family 88 protein n=1 Tax=Actinotalea solisilvae TaxID=2072922 RepID=UPI0018F1D67E|nr:glycoside hydrolase family 88 protein [Actinotalea solisilvae]